MALYNRNGATISYSENIEHSVVAARAPVTALLGHHLKGGRSSSWKALKQYRIAIGVKICSGRSEGVQERVGKPYREPVLHERRCQESQCVEGIGRDLEVWSNQQID